MDAAVPEEPPIVARRRVRTALREARRAKGLSQAEVAEAMEWSTAKVMRIETGEVSITPNDLRPLLAFLGITDREQVETLVQHTKAARSRTQWWDQPPYRTQLTPATRQLIQYEMEATAIFHFVAKIIPGPLQTRAYARAILQGWQGDFSADQLEAFLDVRARRRRQFFARKQPPLLRLLLDESVLYRRVGGPGTLAEQLDDLIGLSESHHAQIRVLPYTVEGPTANAASYDILSLDPVDETNSSIGPNTVVYREFYKEDTIIDDQFEAARHWEIFDRCWQASPPDDESIEMLRKRARQL